MVAKILAFQPNNCHSYAQHSGSGGAVGAAGAEAATTTDLSQTEKRIAQHVASHVVESMESFISRLERLEAKVGGGVGAP